MTKTRASSGRPVLGSGARTACLVEIHGPNLGRTYALGSRRASIGRAPDNVVVLDLDSVSRRHCTLRPQRSGFFIADEDSTNGTYVNERRLGAERALRSGDLLRVGSAVLKFLSDDATSGLEAQYHDAVYRLTITDGLTQVFNRRYLVDFIEREMARCSRHRRPLSLLLLDIDHFKAVNDTHGHLAGDFVLRELAAVLRTRVRREECLARYGGEEFCIVLPEAGRDAAVQRANELRTVCQEHAFDFDGTRIPVTFSGGVAELHQELNGLGALEARRRAAVPSQACRPESHMLSCEVSLFGAGARSRHPGPERPGAACNR
jgi:two-component system, cell cycle response regulator